MKKYLLTVVTLAAFTGISMAQAPAPAAAPAAAPAKVEKPAAKKEVKKAEVTTGEITAVDAAKNTITVKNGKGEEKTFTLDKVGTLAAGAKVKVTVKDGKTAVKEIKEHKKAEGKKAEPKKPEAPKPAAK